MAEQRASHVEELAGAYALGALDPSARLLVDAHVAVCPACARAIEEACRAASLLPYAVDPVAPSVELEERLIGRIGAEKARRAHEFARLGTPPRARSAPNLGRWAARRLLPLAAALALLAGVGTWNLRLQADLAQQAQVNALLARADVRPLVPSPPAGNARGRVYLDPTSGQVLLAVSGMPVLPADRTYQLWLVRPDGRRDSGGTFRVDERGDATLLTTAPGGLSVYATVGVTNEPAGGSPGPTGPRVIGGSLRA